MKGDVNVDSQRPNTAAIDTRENPKISVGYRTVELDQNILVSTRNKDLSRDKALISSDEF